MARDQTTYISNVFLYKVFSSAFSPIDESACTLSDTSAVGVM